MAALTELPESSYDVLFRVMESPLDGQLRMQVCATRERCAVASVTAASLWLAC